MNSPARAPWLGGGGPVRDRVDSCLTAFGPVSSVPGQEVRPASSVSSRAPWTDAPSLAGPSDKWLSCLACRSAEAFTAGLGLGCRPT